MQKSTSINGDLAVIHAHVHVINAPFCCSSLFPSTQQQQHEWHLLRPSEIMFNARDARPALHLLSACNPT